MFFHHFLIIKSFQPWRFSLLSCIPVILATFHLFYIFKKFFLSFWLFSSVLFSVYIPFSSLSSFRCKMSQLWLKVVLPISFSSFDFFSSLKVSIFILVVCKHISFLSFHFFFVFRLYFPMKNVVLHRFFIAPGGFLFLLLFFSGFWFLKMCS